MPANDHFRVAAASIRRGIEAKRMDINQIRSQLEHTKNETNKQIANLQAQIRAKHSDIASSQNNQAEPDKDRATKLKEVADLTAQITKMQHDLAHEHDQANQQIHNMEADLIGLQQLATSLETKN